MGKGGVVIGLGTMVVGIGMAAFDVPVWIGGLLVLVGLGLLVWGIRTGPSDPNPVAVSLRGVKNTTMRDNVFDGYDRAVEIEGGDTRMDRNRFIRSGSRARGPEPSDEQRRRHWSRNIADGQIHCACGWVGDAGDFRRHRASAE
jgi:hypothetical protein